MRPLDVIPELIGAEYTVKGPAFIYEGNLYVVEGSILGKGQIIDLVCKFGNNLCVYSCEEYTPVWVTANHPKKYMLKYVIMKPRLTTQVRLRVVK